MTARTEARITVQLINIGRIFLRGWFLMLTVAVAHAHWWPAIPTVGYWWAVLIMAILPANDTYLMRHYWADEDAKRRGRGLR